jgi:hypothetical protein
MSSTAPREAGQSFLGGVTGLDGGASQGDGQVRLADARRAEEEDVLGAGDEPTGGELADQLGVDRGLELEVKLVERLWPAWVQRTI